MELGTGVFLGAVVLGLVILFAVTKDRWRWGRIILWSASLLAFPVVAFFAWIYVDGKLDERERAVPKVQNEFWGLRIGMPVEDVKFKKGTPTNEADDRWLYRLDGQDATYVVGVSDDKIRYVIAIKEEHRFGRLPDLQGIDGYSTLEDVERKFGLPDYVSTSSDGLRRVLSYKRFNVSFQLRQNTVVALGIFDGSGNPLRLKDERSTGTEEGSKK